MRWYTAALDAPDDMLVEHEGEQICLEIDATTGKEELCRYLSSVSVTGSIPEAMP